MTFDTWSRATARLFITFICASLLAAGCSGGGDDERATGFAASYRSVTADLQIEIEDAKSRTEQASSDGLEGVIRIYEQILSSTEDARAELVALEPPEDISGAYQELLELLEAQESALRELVEAATARDTAGVAEAASRLNELTSDWNQVRAEVEAQLPE